MKRFEPCEMSEPLDPIFNPSKKKAVKVADPISQRERTAGNAYTRKMRYLAYNLGGQTTSYTPKDAVEIELDMMPHFTKRNYYLELPRKYVSFRHRKSDKFSPYEPRWTYRCVQMGIPLADNEEPWMTTYFNETRDGQHYGNLYT